MGVLLLMEATNCFLEALFFVFIVSRAFALCSLNEDNFEWHGDRLNAFSEFLRSLMTCLHSSSNQGFLGLVLVEDLGIVFFSNIIKYFRKIGNWIIRLE